MLPDLVLRVRITLIRISDKHYITRKLANEMSPIHFHIFHWCILVGFILIDLHMHTIYFNHFPTTPSRPLPLGSYLGVSICTMYFDIFMTLTSQLYASSSC